MSEPPATLAFLPWLRRGVSTEITRKVFDQNASTQTHAEFELKLQFENINDAASVNLALHGPGEVVGIDPRIIIRVYPAPEAFNVESNYFPLIEFDQPDFPWRYTPARPDDNERLLPWLVLIVLADEELADQAQPSGSDGKPRSIRVASKFLPDLNQSWAWAHVQISGEIDTSGDHSSLEAITDIVDNEPHRDLSRLLCPRYLKTNTAYKAYLVPSLERGRLAGLNEVVPSDLDALTLAWSNTNGEKKVELPVYYQWRFQTGEAGDFESLVKKLLPPKTLPASVGIRKMDVSEPGARLPSASNTPLYLQGALISSTAREEVKKEEWEETEKTLFIQGLQKIVNDRSSELDNDKTVISGGAVTRLTLAAPLYGRWHIGRKELLPPDSYWFDQLNADPRWRTVAGLGTQVVQSQQQQLMAGAWEQVEGIIEVNQRLRQTQITRAVADRIYERHVKTQNEAVLLQVAAPLLNKIRSDATTTGQETLAETLSRKASGAKAAVAAQLRRVSRAYGPVWRREKRLSPSRSNRTGDPQRLNPNLTSLYRFEVEQDPNNPDPRNRHLIKKELFEEDYVKKQHETVVLKTEPKRLIEAALNRRIEKRGDSKFKVSTILNPIMAAPEFEQPMYKPLSDLSQEWLLPGVGEIPTNTVSLLETNNRFVESYMVGLSHEMARELLWHEYPTDQRGTYFRQFWDVRGYIKPFGKVPEPGDEELKDIELIPKWNKALGENAIRKDMLVLLIRGELLQRYPNAIIYTKNLKNPEVFEGEEKYPIFYGSLPPDLTFLGFDLEPDEVRNNSNWYFVIQEQPTEPRFGLDVAKKYGPPADNWTWRDLSWGQLVPAEDGLNKLNSLIYIDLEEGKNQPDTRLLTPEPPDLKLRAVWDIGNSGDTKSTASDFAYIFFQRPFRVVIQGTKMLPPKESR